MSKTKDQWIREATKQYQDNFDSYLLGDIDYPNYLEKEQGIANTSVFAKQLLEDRNQYQQQLVDAIAAPELVNRYGKDQWSLNGIRALRTRGFHVPVGYHTPGSTLPGFAKAFVRADNLVDQENARIFFSGYHAGKPLEELLQTVRHEGSHFVASALNEERLVRMMDSLYSSQGKDRLEHFYPGASTDNFSDMSNLMHMARIQAKKAQDNLSGELPSQFANLRTITPDIYNNAQLSDEDKLALLNSAPQFKKIHGNGGWTRSLPGDTSWGDFIRIIEQGVGENSILDALKSWTEKPDRERGQHGK